MSGETIRCVRCKGRKKMFKVNSAYSITNTGGVEVQCPICLGTGCTKPLEEAIKEIKKSNEAAKPEKINQKGFKDEEKIRENSEKN